MTHRLFSKADERNVHALSLHEACADTARAMEGMGTVLASVAADAPGAVDFVARACRLRGRHAVLAHFREVLAGTWRFEPDIAGVRILPISADVASFFAPTRITAGPASGPGTAHRFLVNEFAVRTSVGWPIASIVPVPAR